MLYPRCLQCRQILDTKEEIIQGLCFACAQKVPSSSQLPDCAYHPQYRASVTCNHCGSFICDECRVDYPEPAAQKVTTYCRYCAEHMDGQTYYYCAWEDTSISFYRRFWMTWKDIVFHPGGFFNRLPRVHDKTSALTFAYFTSAHAFLLLILLLPFGNYSPSLPQLIMGTLILIGVTTIWLVFIPLVLYFSTFIHHLGILLQGKKRKFHQTFRVIGYANALQILEMLPPVTLLAGIWYVIVVAKGLKRVQDLSTWQAILAIILVPLSLLILSMIILASIYNHPSIRSLSLSSLLLSF
ncbi:MAG: YIP1 family protein [bacterium]